MKRTALGVIVVAALLAGFGCSGGGGTSVNPVAAPSAAQPQTAKATVKIIIPGKAVAAAKKPAYVSTATRSISLTGTGFAPEEVDIPSISSCTGPDGGGAYTCTLSFDIPLGANTLFVKTWDTAGATGNVLSMNTLNTTIVPGVDNNLNMILNGVVKTLTLSVTPGSSFTAGTSANFDAIWGGQDAAANTIIGPGSLVDASGNLIAPTLVSSDPTHFAVGTETGNDWAVAYDGFDDSPTQTLTLAASGYTSVISNLTIAPAATPTPTASPTASPTPYEGIVNGTFATGDLTGWYTCYAVHAQLTAPVSPSPAPTGATAQGATPTPVGTPRPTPTPVSPLAYAGDAGVQTTTPTGDNGGFADFAETGHSEYPYDARGNVGICQNINVLPSATLSFSLYEGGNDSFPTSDTEARIYPSGSFSTSSNGAQAATATPAPLFAESNCYNNLGSVAGTTVAWGGSTGSTRAKICGDNTVPWPGGKWYARSFDMSGYANQSITLFLGIYRSAASGAPGVSTYYNYTYWANVHLTSPGT